MKMRSFPGFTLIELMIAVVVLGLLAVIAFPSYRDHVIKAKRAEGRTALLKAAQLQERYFSDQNAYASTAQLKTAMAVTSASIYSGENPSNDKGNYAITVAVPNPPLSFTLTATPQGSFSDAECGNLTITERGVRCWSTSGTDATSCSPNPANAAKCKW